MKIYSVTYVIKHRRLIESTALLNQNRWNKRDSINRRLLYMWF